MNPYIHPNALVEEGANVGDGTKVWAFAHILPGATIGRNCNICDGVFIEGGAIIGDNVTIKCGVQLWTGIQIAANVFVGPNATFTNDPFPRSKKHISRYPITRLEEGCSIGANATILPGIVIGRGAMVGAGSVVTRNVPPNAVVVGNPAEIAGYSGASERNGLTVAGQEHGPEPIYRSHVTGVFLKRCRIYSDMRGDLTVGEYPEDVPFVVRRHFLVYNVRSREVRGEHAHRKCHQYLVCVAGSVRIAVDDGSNREDFLLDRPAAALYLPPMTWASQYKHSPDAVLLVLASDSYDASDYIRNYGEFLNEAQGGGRNQ